MTAATMLRPFSFQRLPSSSVKEDVDMVKVNIAELESLRTEVSQAEERENYLRAQLEHVDQLLKSARLTGYLYVRTRWSELPGEPPIEEDDDIDDWLPRFIVLHGSAVFYYLQCTDLSPQDTTLLSDIVEVGSLPNITREEGKEHIVFYILTSHGLKIECSSTSKIQVDSWLSALRTYCNLPAQSTT